MQRTILIGLDGATFPVLEALIADGHMPRLGAILEGGVRAELLSTPHPLTPPAWTTLMTGRTPGNHGIFDFIWAEERAEQVYFTLNNFRNIRVETIWSLVSRQGGRVMALNFPLTAPPPHDVAGTIIPGLVSWRHLRRNVHPPDLYPRLQALPDFDPKVLSWHFDFERKATRVVPEYEHEEWVRVHIRREQQWFNLFHHLTRSEPADLVAILIDGIDKLQHVCWRHLDPRVVADTASPVVHRVRALVLEYFQSLDAFLGQVQDWAGPDARIFMASDHGFGPTQSVFRVNQWLAERGYLTWVPTDNLNAEERRKIDNLVMNHFVYLDWKHTRAYAPSPATNGIYIRVARDGAGGGVQPAEYKSFRERLIQDLLQVRDPATGQRVVTKVLQKEDTFPGRYNDRCPDLTLVLHDHGFVSTLNQHPIVWQRPDLAGTHRPEGIFAACGPGIPAGQVLTQQSILDVAATLLYSLGLPIPDDFESRVMETVFEPALLQAQPVRSGPPTQPPPGYTGKRLAPPDAGEAQVIQQLRALGYVE